MVWTLVTLTHHLIIVGSLFGDEVTKPPHECCSHTLSERLIENLSLKAILGLSRAILGTSKDIPPATSLYNHSGDLRCKPNLDSTEIPPRLCCNSSGIISERILGRLLEPPVKTQDTYLSNDLCFWIPRQGLTQGKAPRLPSCSAAIHKATRNSSSPTGYSSNDRGMYQTACAIQLTDSCSQLNLGPKHNPDRLGTLPRHDS